jgi:hypothetical protein
MEEVIRILPRLLRAVGYEESICERVLHAVWARIVGDAVAAHARPVRLREKHLLILASDRTWKAQLERLSPDIRARINRVFGEELVHAIEYRVERRRGTADALPSGEGALSPEVRTPHRERLLRELAPWAEKIADPDLRDAFLRAASRCLERRESA